MNISISHRLFGRAVLALALLCCLGLPEARAAALQAPSADLDSGFVLVLPFEASGDNAARIEDELPMVLGQRLTAKGVMVMPREEMLALAARLGLEPGSAQAVRRLLEESGAEAAVYGGYAQVGLGFAISARLVQAGDEQPRSFRVEQNDTANFLFGVEDLAGRLVSELRKFSVIDRVEVRGTQSLDPEVVLLRINSRQGDPIDPAALDRELKRIWDLGYFDDIVLELEQTPNGVNLIYNVVEKPRISRIIIQGNEELTSSDIRGVMSTNPGNVLNERTLFVDKQAIYDEYRKKGYYLATVETGMEMDEATGGHNLVISVNEGDRLYITKVNVSGNEHVSARRIRGRMELGTRGLFSFLTGSGVLQEELLERDASAILHYYMTLGYLDVQVPTPQVEYTEKGIEINVQVSEGVRYRMSGVNFAGELIDSDAVLAEHSELHKLAGKKEYFDISVMQSDMDALKNLYSDYGYAFAEVTPQQRKDNSDPAHPTVSVTYNILKNQKVYVRNIIIEGNVQTRDNVVLREMRLVDGDQFSGSKLTRSMRRLNSLGHFASAESELVPTQNESEVDLKVKLQEQSTGAIMGGVGYSTYSKFGVMASIQESNLWGKGYNLGFYTLFSGLRNSYNLNFTNPRFNDTYFSLGVDAYRLEDDYIDYDRDTTGAGVRLGYPLGEYTTFVVGYKAERYKLSNFAIDTSQVLRRYSGNRLASVGSLILTRDTTDRSRPTDGTMVQMISEYAGNVIGSDDEYLRLTGEVNLYKQISEASVAHMRVKGSTLLNYSEENTPVFERFWMGGMESVRGYDPRDIVPRDPIYGDRIGGTRMAFVNLEYIYQLSRDIGLNVVPFYDMGFNIDHDQYENLWDEQKRSLGVELRWRSPMGDLRFSYGYPLDNGWGGKSLGGKFEFSIGKFF